MCTRFRTALRLFATRRCVQFGLPINQRLDIHHVAAVLHRFEESIAGRPYLIEVAAVADNRWRAYIVRIPGVPTALMPFYGRTPLEAAQHLRDWLSRAHARAASPTPAV
jgi:glutathione S-transferase